MRCSVMKLAEKGNEKRKDLAAIWGLNKFFPVIEDDEHYSLARIAREVARQMIAR